MEPGERIPRTVHLGQRLSLHVHPVLAERPLFLTETPNVDNVASKGIGDSAAGTSVGFLSETIFGPSVELN